MKADRGASTGGECSSQRICEPFGCVFKSQLTYWYTHAASTGNCTLQTHTACIYTCQYTDTVHRCIHTYAHNYCLKTQWQHQMFCVSGASQFPLSFCKTCGSRDTLDIRIHVVWRLRHAKLTNPTDKRAQIQIHQSWHARTRKHTQYHMFPHLSALVQTDVFRALRMLRVSFVFRSKSKALVIFQMYVVTAHGHF